MTQEEINLLTRDICARLPYGVKARLTGWDEEKETEVKVTLKAYSINTDGYVYFEDNEYDIHYLRIEDCDWCLRPVSSMTEEEMDRLFDILRIDKGGAGDDWIKINDVKGIEFFLPSGKWMENIDAAIGYLRSIHIDIYDFIGSKIAVEATDDIYRKE